MEALAVGNEMKQFKKNKQKNNRVNRGVQINAYWEKKLLKRM